MDIKTIAFKAEMDAENGLEHAKQLLSNKSVDAVCYNLLQDSNSFGTEENEISFITANNITSLGKADKLTLSNTILLEAQRLAND
jgi:phosphopantothenoylcysteine decarboxylase/phosphopantothenate--cysteine ligase